MNPMETAALGFARRGLHVFPCKPRGKAPCTANGMKDATIGAKQISAWWHEWPEANIGLRTGKISGLFVLDIDGFDGETSLRQLEEKHGALPPTAEVITGKGRHFYFQCPVEGTISNSVRKLGDGLDIRGDGGYVIAPPSVHESGKQYAWSVDSGDQLRDAPAWLLDLIRQPSPQCKATPLEAWRSIVRDGVAEGGRNDALSRLAGKLLRHGIDPFVTLDLCQSWNETRCVPPLPANEVTQTVNSIAGRELARRRKK